MFSNFEEIYNKILCSIFISVLFCPKQNEAVIANPTSKINVFINYCFGYFFVKKAIVFLAIW